MPTLLGKVSIASGYTLSTLARAMPWHPLPLKGRKRYDLLCVPLKCVLVDFSLHLLYTIPKITSQTYP